MPSRAVKTMIAAIAAAAAGVFLHWALVQPALLPPQGLRVPIFVQLVLGTGAGGSVPPNWLRHLNLVLIAAVGLMVAGLSLFIGVKSRDHTGHAPPGGERWRWHLASNAVLCSCVVQAHATY